MSRKAIRVSDIRLPSIISGFLDCERVGEGFEWETEYGRNFDRDSQCSTANLEGDRVPR